MVTLKKKRAEEVPIKFKFFYIKTDRPDEFVDKLEQLCRKYCSQENFLFNYSVEG